MMLMLIYRKKILGVIARGCLKLVAINHGTTARNGKTGTSIVALDS